jgi:nuclear GTP-binding protein
MALMYLAAAEDEAEEDDDDDIEYGSDAADADSEAEAAPRKPSVKEARVKTNKVRAARTLPSSRPMLMSLGQQKKATNFYAAANVKGKNREKAALMRSLPVGKRRR